MTMLKVLIVEDQPAVVTALQVLFEIRGVACALARSPAEALRRLDGEAADEIGAVVQDMNFSPEATSGEEGIALFREIKRRDAALPVLLLTAWTSLETAVQLVKEGASDYLAKPWDDEKLLAAVRNLLELRELQLENARLRGRARRSWEDLAGRHDLAGAVWASEKMHAAVTLALQVARGDVPVLITGPSGAGKEKLAEIVQANSRRREKPFVRVNAGALPDELPLAERLLRDLSPSPTGSLWRLHPDARERLVGHPWPGNVRELENTLRRAVLGAAGDTLRAEDLGLSAAPFAAGSSPALEGDE